MIPIQSPFIYDKDIPDVLLPELKRNLEQWTWVIPVWCERVFVGYSVDCDDEGATACCRVEYPYRWARITFFPCFLTQHDPGKDALHELIHIPLAVAGDWAREKFKTLVSEDDNPTLRQSLLDDLKDRVESATEDIASRIAAQTKT
ncbi:MAG: hypothetical protein AABN95_16055 [Acidobacteriota bacterium]